MRRLGRELRQAAAVGFVHLYRLRARAGAKAFSVLAGGAFAAYGRRSVLQPPIRLSGEARIAVGSDVFIGSGSWLQVLDEGGDGVAIMIGDGTSIAGNCVVSAACSVQVGRNVLMARNVYIADHMHAFESTARAVLEQGITRVQSVEIGDGVWLGQNVVIGPGVRIGRGAVIGANSVVLDEVPDHAVAVGAPARVVRSFAPEPAETISR
jgi:acetyltransferase-like isoleucine patch superfamily enzyme